MGTEPEAPFEVVWVGTQTRPNVIQIEAQGNGEQSFYEFEFESPSALKDFQSKVEAIKNSDAPDKEQQFQSLIDEMNKSARGDFEVIWVGTKTQPDTLQVEIRSKGNSSFYDYEFASPFIVQDFKNRLDAIKNSDTPGKGKRYQALLQKMENASKGKYERRRDIKKKVQAQVIPERSREIAGKMTAEFYENEDDQNFSKWVVKDTEGVLVEALLNELFPEGDYIYEDVSSEEYGEKLIKMIRNIGLEDTEDEIYALNAGMKKCAYTDYSDINLQNLPKDTLIKLLLAIMNEIPINEGERSELDDMSKRIKEIIDSRED